MGLTINYTLSVKKPLRVAEIRELVERAARYAKKIGCVEVSRVWRANGDRKTAGLFVTVGRPEDGCFGFIPATHGWLATAWPGKGSEDAKFGLCQYSRRVPYRNGTVPSGFTGGWLLQGSCKTQYAAEHGWDHFLLCHKRVISLLEFWRQLGVTVEVMDEGGYWETRSEEKLRAALQAYDHLIGALAGMCKDAADEAGPGLRVEAPIFARKDFERLEAEARRELARPLS